MGAAIVAILVCVVIAAAGRGGELARFPGDYAPPDFGAMAAVDVALLRPPTALWGYNMQATDEALSRIATAISVRDVRIASLEQQIADLRAGRPARAEAPEPGAPVTQTLAGHESVEPHVGAAAPSRQWAADAGWPGTPGAWRRNAATETAGVGEDASRKSETGPEPQAGRDSEPGRDPEPGPDSAGAGEPQPNSKLQPPAKEKAEQAAVRAQPDEEEAW